MINTLNALRIGIVGGGPAGVLLSRLLRERRGNVDDIVIFEKEDRIVPAFTAYRIDSDKSIDIGTKLTPSRSFVPGEPGQFTDIYGKLKEIFDDVKKTFGTDTTFKPYPQTYYDFDNNQITVPPIFARGYDFETEFGPQLITGLGVFHMVTKYTTKVSDVYNVIFLCNKGETLYEWGQRTGLNLAAEYIAGIGDTFMAEVIGEEKTGIDHPCSYMLRRASLMSIDTFRIPLISAGIDGDNPLIDVVLGQFPFPPDVVQFVKDALNAPLPPSAIMAFEVGYQTIFEQVAQIEVNNGVSMRLNAEVVDIEVNDGGILRFEVSQSIDGDTESCQYLFDAVFVTVRPIDAIKFLKDSAFTTAFNLYDKAKNEAGVFVAALFNTENWIDDQVTNPFVFLSSDQYNLKDQGTFDWYKILENQCFPLALFHDFFDQPFFAGNGFGPRTIDEHGDISLGDLDECLMEMINYLNDIFDFNMDFNDIVAKIQHKYYPYIISPELEASGWWESFEAIQGKNNVFYYGEVFSTNGIYNVLRYIDQNIDATVDTLNDIQGKVAKGNNDNCDSVESVELSGSSESSESSVDRALFNENIEDMNDSQNGYNLMVVSFSTKTLENLWVIIFVFVFVNGVLFWCFHKNRTNAMSFRSTPGGLHRIDPL